jgi:hypothetical protein
MNTIKYQCVLCFETAEHIEPSGTDQFCDNLVGCLEKEGMMFFTGAPVGQDGCGHINCQSKFFWIKKFSDRGLVLNKSVTSLVSTNWEILGAPNYISQNLIVLNHDK